MDREVRHTKVSGKGDEGSEMTNSIDPSAKREPPLPNDAALLTKPQPAILVSQAWKKKFIIDHFENKIYHNIHSLV